MFHFTLHHCIPLHIGILTFSHFVQFHFSSTFLFIILSSYVLVPCSDSTSFPLSAVLISSPLSFCFASMFFYSCFLSVPISFCYIFLFAFSIFSLVYTLPCVLLFTVSPIPFVCVLSIALHPYSPPFWK